MKIIGTNAFDSSIVLAEKEEEKEVSKESPAEKKADTVKDVISGVTPLEKTVQHLKKAMETLDGTMFEDLKQSISGCVDRASEQIEQVLTETVERLKSERMKDKPAAITPEMLSGKQEIPDGIERPQPPAGPAGMFEKGSVVLNGPQVKKGEKYEPERWQLRCPECNSFNLRVEPAAGRETETEEGKQINYYNCRRCGARLMDERYFNDPPNLVFVDEGYLVGGGDLVEEDEMAVASSKTPTTKHGN